MPITLVWPDRWVNQPGSLEQMPLPDDAAGDWQVVDTLARLHDALRRNPGAAVVVEGRNIVAFAALAERNLELSISGALLYLPAGTVAAALADLSCRKNDELWFAPLPFPAVLAVPEKLLPKEYNRIGEMAQDWGARLVSALALPEDAMTGRITPALKARLRALIPMRGPSAQWFESLLNPAIPNLESFRQ